MTNTPDNSPGNSPITADVQALAAWRQSWNFDTLEWREAGVSYTQERDQRKADARRKRSRKDRRAFGEETWGVSESHQSAKFRPEVLRRYGLPLLDSEFQLAQWLGVSLSRLRWYSHDKAADTVWHYLRYTIPKRSGGERVILAPKTELKALQRRLLDDLLTHIPVSESAHGFVPGRSIVSNAQPHVGKAVVLNLDLKDFFPSVSFARVRGLFIAWGYSFSVASALALLCTERDRVSFERSNQNYWVSVGPRTLIQGAPTSPALANLSAWRLDRRLNGLAIKHGFGYTRYADDLTFSGGSINSALRILAAAQRIIVAEGFALNAEKTRLQRAANRQTVTGVVVNDEISVLRTVRRQLRAILHNAAQTGLAAQNRADHPAFREYVQGLIAYMHAVNPTQAAPFAEKFAALHNPR